ncbi:glycosyltransferase family 4 protein [Dehalococcoidia bacterium]|nr:glycosyltransferase family 4 protein [Dehalococcoidia bacterium]
MKILYISQYYPPETGAPAARVSEMARHWVRAGHRVTVLTGFPINQTGIVDPDYRSRMRKLFYREEIDGVDVIRTWLMPLPNRRVYERVLVYVSFLLSSSLRGIFLSRPDVIIATSPQLLVGLTGLWLSLIKRVPSVLEIRDLWPESLAASGVGRSDSLMTRSLRMVASLLYRSCDHVVTVTEAIRDALITWQNLEPKKVSVVENGVETDIFAPTGPTESVKNSLGLEGKFVVSYIGTLGQAHGLEVAIQAAGELRDRWKDIQFLMVGEGAEKDNLVDLATRAGLGNVRFLDGQPRQEIPSLIRASDVCLVMLKKNTVFETVVPTKMLEFMACGRPVILCVNGQARSLLESAKGGLYVEPGNATGLAEAIVHLKQDASLREALGMSGRRYVVENMTRAAKACQYVDVLNTIAGVRRR